MKEGAEGILQLWKDTFTNKIKGYTGFDEVEKFKYMAALFSPGKLYYYIINFHDLSFEYLHPGIKEVLGLSPNQTTIFDILQLLPDEEAKSIHQKETFVLSFFEQVQPSDILHYKALYTYRSLDNKGSMHQMLLQAVTLSTTNLGIPEHVLCIHTDITHLRLSPVEQVSFIHLQGGPNHFRCDPSLGKFDPTHRYPTPEQLTSSFSPRELDIIRLLALGKSSVEISQSLGLSSHTIRTHRANILQKANCKNTTQLVAQCLMEGVLV
ncbi:hypothetical protein BFP72_04255 [Reichenbachiella sp. 5M10]|nr:hypothetical protein BFP72_04255 [Reichenbachiella sp. 5M10]